MRKIVEVKNDYTDDENYTFIDAYFDEDDNSEGKTICAVCQETGKALFFDNSYRNDEKILEAIKEVTPKSYHKVAQAKAYLKSQGYYTDNLWCIDDAKCKFKCTDEEAHILVGQALSNDATMEQIWFAMDFHGEDNGLTKIDE
jgi:hypothetical protein